MKQTTPRSKFNRILLWTGGVLGGLVLLLAIAFGVMMARMNYVPSNLD